MGYRSDKLPDEIHGLTANLNRQDELTPEVHYFTREALPWIHIADELPRYADGGRTPEDAGAVSD